MEPGRYYITEPASGETFVYDREDVTLTIVPGLGGHGDGVQVERVHADGRQELLATHPDGKVRFLGDGEDLEHVVDRTP